jgi:hypothetical protein
VPSARGRFLLAIVAVGVGLTVGLVLTTSSHGAKPPTRDVYLARARAICREYGRQLDRIPPIQDPTLLGDVLESANAALPILREQAARIRGLAPPVALRSSIDRFFSVTDRSIDTLESVRDAARHMDSNRAAVGLIRFGRETAAAKRIGRRIGYGC